MSLLCQKKKRARLRRQHGGLVSLCLIVAFALMLGTGLLKQQPFQPQEPFQEALGTSVSDPSESPVSPIEKQGASFEVASDSYYGDYEKDTVLVLVDEATDLDQVNAVLNECDFASTKNVSDQDSSAGFVRVAVTDDVSMKAAISALEDEGLEAQPNYVYYPVEDTAEDMTGVKDTATTNEMPDDSEEIVEADTSGSGERPKGCSVLESDFATVSQLFATSPVSADNGSIESDSDASTDPELSASATVSIDDPEASTQWALESLDVYRAWGIVKCKDDDATSPKVSVAVVDTGCNPVHEDLVSNIRGTYNSVSQSHGVDQVIDSTGHGTHVAGIVSADANNGKGVAGVSYDAGLVIIKASIGDTRNFSTQTLAQAYTWLMSNSGGSTVAKQHNVRVVNMSVGGPGSIDRDNALYKKITQAKNAGILTVCAAGNSDNGVPPYNALPGDYEDCFTVINLAKTDGVIPNDAGGAYCVERYSGSNYNDAANENEELRTAKNISAPGTGINSTTCADNSSYGYLGGTSMAAPAVSGVAALLFAYDPSLSAEDARTILEQTATPIGSDGWNSQTGHGEVDAYHALQVASAEIANGVIDNNAAVTLTLCSADNQSLNNSDWMWESSDPNILQVDSQTGEATPISNGSATLTATHKKIASKTISKQVKVGNLDLSTVNVAFNARQTFTGSQIRPSITVTASSGEILHEGTDFVVTYGENINVGSTGTMTLSAPSGSDNTTSKTVNFEIVPYDLSQMNTAGSIGSVDYTGAPVEPRPVLNLNGYSLRAGIDYDITYYGNTEPGEGIATITGKGNFTGESSIPFRVQASFADAKVTLSETERTYTGSEIKPDVTVTCYGKTLVKGFDYTVTYKNNINAGTAEMEVKGNIGYDKDGGYPQKFTFKINPVNISNNESFAVGSIIDPTYNGKAQTPTP